MGEVEGVVLLPMTKFHWRNVTDFRACFQKPWPAPKNTLLHIPHCVTPACQILPCIPQSPVAQKTHPELKPQEKRVTHTHTHTHTHPKLLAGSCLLKLSPRTILLSVPEQSFCEWKASDCIQIRQVRSLSLFQWWHVQMQRWWGFSGDPTLEWPWHCSLPLS